MTVPISSTKGNSGDGCQWLWQKFVRKKHPQGLECALISPWHESGFSGGEGSPQHNFHQALITIEAMVPVVVWFDEIEQLIESARIHALGQDLKLTTAMILDEAPDIVPLAHTMSEQIKAIKNWAWDRAISASDENPMTIEFDIN